MGALALIAVFAVAASALWQRSCSTSYSNGWLPCNSSSVSVSPGTYQIKAVAPASSHDCNYRRAAAARSCDGHWVGSVDCPAPDTGQPTESCCVKSTWTPSVCIGYYAHAEQNASGNQNCGPTTGYIGDYLNDCVFDNPGGP